MPLHWGRTHALANGLRWKKFAGALLIGPSSVGNSFSESAAYWLRLWLMKSHKYAETRVSGAYFPAKNTIHRCCNFSLGSHARQLAWETILRRANWFVYRHWLLPPTKHPVKIRFCVKMDVLLSLRTKLCCRKYLPHSRLQIQNGKIHEAIVILSTARIVIDAITSSCFFQFDCVSYKISCWARVYACVCATCAKYERFSYAYIEIVGHHFYRYLKCPLESSEKKICFFFLRWSAHK